MGIGDLISQGRELHMAAGEAAKAAQEMKNNPTMEKAKQTLKLLDDLEIKLQGYTVPQIRKFAQNHLLPSIQATREEIQDWMEEHKGEDKK